MYRILREQQSEGREDGFTLIELLVVVIIIGILAAIAIPVFLNQRERAWRSAVQSDLRNASVAEETYYTDEGAYTSDVVNDLEPLGYNPTEDVTVLASVDGDQVYCLAGQHANNTAETWFLGTGGTLEDTFAAGCPESTTDPSAGF